MGLKEHLEDHLTSAYAIGTTKEMDKCDTLYLIKHNSGYHLNWDGAPFGYVSFAQFVALAAALIAGKETGSDIYSGVSLYLAADLSWRFLKSTVCEETMSHQSGLIGTVRTLYQKFTNKSKAMQDEEKIK